jgi:hypothetical protein
MKGLRHRAARPCWRACNQRKANSRVTFIVVETGERHAPRPVDAQDEVHVGVVVEGDARAVRVLVPRERDERKAARLARHLVLRLRRGNRKQ